MDIDNLVDVEVTNRVKLFPEQGVRVIGRGRKIADWTYPHNQITEYMDVSGIKTIYIYLWHSKQVNFEYEWSVTDGTESWSPPLAYFPTNYPGSGLEVITLTTVRGNSIGFKIVTPEDDNEITCWVYASPV